MLCKQTSKLFSFITNIILDFYSFKVGGRVQINLQKYNMSKIRNDRI